MLFAFKQSSIWGKYGPIKICGRQSLKNLKLYGLPDMACLSRPYHFKFFKGCLPQTLLGPFLSILSHLLLLQESAPSKMFDMVLTMVLTIRILFLRM